MKTIVLLVIGSTLASASQSLIMTTGTAVTNGTLTAAAAYSAVASWRVEGQLNTIVVPAATSGIFEINGGMAIRITSAGSLQVLDYNTSGGCSLSLGSSTAIRFVVQRNNTTGNYTVETWDMANATGGYQICSAAIQVVGTHDFRSSLFSVGSLFEASNMNTRIGFLRWFSTNRTLGGAPPDMTLATSSTGDLIDFEFEGNLTDQSPQANTWALASPSYATTATFNPSRSFTAPLSLKVGSATTFNASASYSNVDNPVVTCVWSQLAGAAATIGGSATCTSLITVPSFGEYTFRLVVTDALANSTNADTVIGGVVTDANDVVTGTAGSISAILGPTVRLGTGAWSWSENRNQVVADYQISLLDVNYPVYWNTPGTGTLSATNGSATLTFTGVNAQTVFCGGGASPVSATSVIYIWYPSADYAGQFGRGRYTVLACPTSATVTIDNPTGMGGYQQTAGTTAGLQYSVVDPAGTESHYIYTPIPANYYDGVLAYYSLYYRSGLTVYRDAARSLASRFWAGPNYDLGNSYNIAAFNGAYIVAGPARGQSALGLVLWYLDTGTNIWPGMHHLWDDWLYSADYFMAQGQIGDAREFSRVMSGMAICARYDTDATYRANCATKLGLMVDFMAGLQINNHWTNTTTTNAFYGAADGTVYVTVVDGSANITLTGSTWSAGTFTGARLWFTTPKTNVSLPGNKNSDAGDPVDYALGSYVDSTHATLAVPYASGVCPGPGGCQRGLQVSVLTGFGWQPYQFGNWMAILGKDVYGYYASVSNASRMAQVKGFLAAGTAYLGSVGWNSTDKSMYAGRGFISCEPEPHGTFCTDIGALSQAGESIGAFSWDYRLNSTSSSLTTGDDIFQAMWCKPGTTCPYIASGTYMVDIDDPGVPGAYMIGPSFILSKWLGFFFGYGYTASWPASRQLAGGGFMSSSMSGAARLSGAATLQ